MTLIELIVALCLFSILMLICDNIYLLGRRISIEIHLQMENFYKRALVFNFLNPFIQQAGFWGLHNTFSGNTQTESNPIHIHYGHSSGWSPPLPAALKSRVAKGTDVLILEYSIAPWIFVIQPALHHQPEWLFNTDPPWESGWYVLSDENQYTIFEAQIQSLGTQFAMIFPGNMPWKEGEPALLSRYERVAYYLRESQEGYDLMRKKLDPIEDAVHLVKELPKWYWSDDGGILRLQWERETESGFSFKKTNA